MTEALDPFVEIAVPLAYCLFPPAGVLRPVVAIVLHDTETATPARCHPEGSWHWQILRDGTIEHHVDETAVAFGVRAADRWRPDWVVTSPYPVSDVNWCTLHVEFQSCQADRDAGTPYTDAQYGAARRLLAYIEGVYGALPIVGHGEVQIDRSDPVAFAWDRVEIGPLVPGQGHYWLAATGDADDMSQLQALQAELDQAQGVARTLQEQLDAVREMLAQANSTIGALSHDVIPPLEDELAALKSQMDPAMTDALKAHVADLEQTIAAAQSILAAAGPAPAT